MEIHLLRHPKPLIAENICYGQSNIDISTPIQNLDFNKLVHNNYDEIFASPLKRCTKVAAMLDQPFYIDRRLQEVNFGTWEKQAWDAIPPHEIDPWYEDYIQVKPPQGESFLDLIARVRQFYLEISTKHLSKKILVITHLGVIRAFAHIILETNIHNVFKLNVPYGQIIQFKVYE